MAWVGRIFEAGDLGCVVNAPALCRVVLVYFYAPIRVADARLGEAHEFAVVEIEIVVVILVAPCVAGHAVGALLRQKRISDLVVVGSRARDGRGSLLAALARLALTNQRVGLLRQNNPAPCLVVGGVARITALDTGAVAVERVLGVGRAAAVDAVHAVACLLPAEGLGKTQAVTCRCHVVAVAGVALAPEGAPHVTRAPTTGTANVLLQHL